MLDGYFIVVTFSFPQGVGGVQRRTKSFRSFISFNALKAFESLKNMSYKV